MSTAAAVLRRVRRLINDETNAAVSGYGITNAALLKWVTEAQRAIVALKPEAYVFTRGATVSAGESRQLLSAANIIPATTDEELTPYRLVRVECNGVATTEAGGGGSFPPVTGLVRMFGAADEAIHIPTEDFDSVDNATPTPAFEFLVEDTFSKYTEIAYIGTDLYFAFRYVSSGNRAAPDLIHMNDDGTGAEVLTDGNIYTGGASDPVIASLRASAGGVTVTTNVDDEGDGGAFIGFALAGGNPLDNLVAITSVDLDTIVVEDAIAINGTTAIVAVNAFAPLQPLRFKIGSVNLSTGVFTLLWEDAAAETTSVLAAGEQNRKIWNPSPGVWFVGGVTVSTLNGVVVASVANPGPGDFAFHQFLTSPESDFRMTAGFSADEENWSGDPMFIYWHPSDPFNVEVFNDGGWVPAVIQYEEDIVAINDIIGLGASEGFVVFGETADGPAVWTFQSLDLPTFHATYINATPPSVRGDYSH